MKLTAERCNGIRHGYWSAAKKDELVQKLGAIEKEGHGLLDRICGEVCSSRTLQDGSPALCEVCPAQKLRRLLR